MGWWVGGLVGWWVGGLAGWLAFPIVNFCFLFWCSPRLLWWGILLTAHEQRRTPTKEPFSKRGNCRNVFLGIYVRIWRVGWRRCLLIWWLFFACFKAMCQHAKGSLNTVDGGRNAAPPKRPRNDDSPANTNNRWFPIVLKWCRIWSIHSIAGRAKAEFCFFSPMAALVELWFCKCGFNEKPKGRQPYHRFLGHNFRQFLDDPYFRSFDPS